MKIDTSREAVERILEGVTPGPWGCSMGKLVRIVKVVSRSPIVLAGVHRFGRNGGKATDGDCEANARFIAASRELVPALLAERDAALADVARLSVALAEVERELTLTQEAYDAAVGEVTRLSTAIAAETAKREAMEAELRTVETDLAEAEDKFHIASFYISDEQTKTCVMDRVKWMAKAGSRVRATLAQHGKVK